MTKKHFKAIAKIMSDVRFLHREKINEQPKNVIGDIEIRLALYFENENSRFDIHKFLDACQEER